MQLESQSVSTTNTATEEQIENYMGEHLQFMVDKLDATKGELYISVIPERPKYEVYIELKDGRAFQFQCSNLKEFMINMYGNNPIPNL